MIQTITVPAPKPPIPCRLPLRTCLVLGLLLGAVLAAPIPGRAEDEPLPPETEEGYQWQRAPDAAILQRKTLEGVVVNLRTGHFGPQAEALIAAEENPSKPVLGLAGPPTEEGIRPVSLMEDPDGALGAYVGERVRVTGLPLVKAGVPVLLVKSVDRVVAVDAPEDEGAADGGS